MSQSLDLHEALTVAGTWLPWLLTPAAVLLAFSEKDALFNAAAGQDSSFILSSSGPKSGLVWLSMWR